MIRASKNGLRSPFVKTLAAIHPCLAGFKSGACIYPKIRPTAKQVVVDRPHTEYLKQFPDTKSLFITGPVTPHELQKVNEIMPDLEELVAPHLDRDGIVAIRQFRNIKTLDIWKVFNHPVIVQEDYLVDENNRQTAMYDTITKHPSLTCVKWTKSQFSLPARTHFNFYKDRNPEWEMLFIGKTRWELLWQLCVLTAPLVTFGVALGVTYLVIDPLGLWNLAPAFVPVPLAKAALVAGGLGFVVVKSAFIASLG
eukprot:TRINITY_DN85160_c0_g1_i1.p1 TRINITY_DN85160_c0_g1~~TRINITY_DN85160_c0_g1_i1.p1  ORF type:complete len:253 (+),score=20.80 TRINITY_DN85160_c0_g1_i1:32-790(+)